MNFRVFSWFFGEFFDELCDVLLTLCTVVKSKVEISQNFVAFSEYMNLKNIPSKVLINYKIHQFSNVFGGHLYMIFGKKLPLDKFDFISFSVLEVMRSPLAPTVYRRSRQQRGIVPPVFYISHAVTILKQKSTFRSKIL